MIRLVARALLRLILAASVALSGFNAVAIYRAPVFSIFAEASEQEITAAYNRLMAKAVSDETLAANLGLLLDSPQRDWSSIDAVLEVAQDRGIAPSAALAARVEVLRAQDYSFRATAVKCARCIWDTARCDIPTLLICRVPVELLPVGDVLVLIREAGKYISGSDVDRFDLIFATIGLGAVVIVLLTGGSSVTVKVGASVLRLARRAGVLSNRLTHELTEAAWRAIDWDLIAKSSYADLPETIGKAINPRALKPIVDVIGSVGAMAKKLGAADALSLVRHADSSAEVATIVRISNAVGRKAIGAAVFVGKSRLFRLALRYSDDALALLMWLAGLVASLLAFVTSLSSRFLLRRLDHQGLNRARHTPDTWS